MIKKKKLLRDHETSIKVLNKPEKDQLEKQKNNRGARRSVF